MMNSSVIHANKRVNWMGCAMLFVLLVALANNAAAQGTGTISGRLMVGEKPAGGFTVFVVQDSNSSRQNAPVARGVADSEGRYQLTGLVAGKYRVRASAPSYVVEKGSEYSFIIGTLVELKEGETVENIDLKLTRGAVITGKITAPDGKPLIGTRLTVKRQNEKGEYTFYSTSETPFQMMQTDDRGVYRLYGLPAGKYLIGAGAEGSRGVAAFDGVVNYPLTFYPNITSEAAAKPIEVTAGDTKRDIDIRLAVAETVKGWRALVKVIDSETGKPMPAAQVACFSIKNNYPSGAFRPMATNEKGEIAFEGLASGRYIVDMTNMGIRVSDNLYADYISTPVIFELNDSDNEELVINAKRGLSIIGNVKLEGEPNAAMSAQLAQLNMSGYNQREPNQPFVIRNDSYSKISADGSFKLSGFKPGKVGIRLAGDPRSPQKFHVLRVEQNGVPVKDWLTIPEGESVTGVTLVCVYGESTLRGEVQVVGGMLPPGTQMRVVARRSDAGANGSSVGVNTDARGRFMMENLSSGEHRVTLSFSPTSGGATAAAALPRPLTQTVVVPASGEAQMMFTLNLTPKENQQ